jgi:hypothetical protein
MGVAAARPPLPGARGPLSHAVIRALAEAPDGSRWPGTGSAHSALPAPLVEAEIGSAHPWSDDLQLALYLCYELHYRGFRDVSDAWEWDPGLLAFRAGLERRFLDWLRDTIGPPPSVAAQIDELLIDPDDGTGPSFHLLHEGEPWQVREYLAHRSLYHLKEADPQTWVVPRVHGAAQAALVALQYDEYGGGRPDQVHSQLFADMMAAWGLDPTYGVYVDAAPAESLALVNLMSLFGLHRAHAGALIGQFARAEISSSPSSRRLVEAFLRLGGGVEERCRFYREHVEADAVHEQLIRHGVIAALVKEEPELARDVAFGLAASGLLDDRFAQHVVGCWESGDSSLRRPLEEPGDAGALGEPTDVPG